MPDPALTRSHALPLPPTPLIGRAEELAEVCGRLRDAETRLLTLTGAPGTGKTRLALAAAASLTGDFDDGVRFVPLDAVRDPEHVAAAIAQAAAVQEAGGRPLLEILADAFAERELVLLLDNFEHVLPAAPVVAVLLTACLRLTVLATSRAPLRLRWEQEFPVEPLALPPVEAPNSEFRVPRGARAEPAREDRSSELVQEPDRLLDYAAVQLFVTRARAVRPEFRLTTENAGTVAEICRRLDGLPLAIELAAARARLFSPGAILARLEHRLELLTQGARDLPPRHQTLRAAIGWSYDLLTPTEQTLFRRLGVFAGGCTLEAAEVVAGNAVEAPRVFELLSALVDHSLLVREEQPDGEPRLRMLGTLHEFAQEQLAVAGEEAATRLQHAAFFLSLATAAEPKLRGPEQGTWADRLELEHDNLRAALRWLIETGEAREGLRLGYALWRFWTQRGHPSEARSWLTRLLSLPRASQQPRPRSDALFAAGALAWEQGDYAAARELLEESLDLAREAQHDEGISGALTQLGHVAFWQGLDAEARALYEESLAVRRRSGDEWGIAISLGSLGRVITRQGDLPAARLFHEESLSTFRKVGDRRSTAAQLGNLGVVAAAQGDHAQAVALQEESLTLSREVADPWLVAASLVELGRLCAQQGDLDAAQARYEESLALAQELHAQPSVVSTLGSLGDVARERGEYARAETFYEQALDVCRQTGDRPLTAVMIEKLATAARLQRRYVDAQARYGECLTLDMALGIRPSIARDLDGLAPVVTALGLPERAARLLAGAEALRDGAPANRDPARQADYETSLATVRMALGDAAFTSAWAAGVSMPLDDLVADALSLAKAEVPAGPAASRASLPDGLTPREVDVLGLLAAGLSNREIAAALVVSVRTVERHVDNIYGKIGVHDRRQARHYARAHGLLAPEPAAGR